MLTRASVNQGAQYHHRILLLLTILAAIATTAVLLAGAAPSSNAAAQPPSGLVSDVAPNAGPAAGEAPRAEIDAATAASATVATRSIVLVGWEHWDAISLANVQQAIASLPGTVQAQLGNPVLGPVKVVVNSEGRTLSGYQPYGRAANFFSTNEGSNELVLYPQQSVFTIVHELGHAFNLRRAAAGNYASVLIDPEMQSFMAATGWTVQTPQSQIAAIYDHMQVAVSHAGPLIWASMSRNDPLEDFANSFAMYFVDPGDLARRSPERFAWFAARF